MGEDARHRVFREEWLAKNQGQGRPGRLIRHAAWTGWMTMVLVASFVVAIAILAMITVPGPGGHHTRLLTLLVP